VQVRHVQRSGQSVEQADADQKQDGRDEVDGHIFDAAVELCLVAAQDQETEGGDQHHLEPDIQVEQIAGDEGTADPGQEHLEQRVISQRLTP